MKRAILLKSSAKIERISVVLTPQENYTVIYFADKTV
jgi:hypothetical protein